MVGAGLNSRWEATMKLSASFIYAVVLATTIASTAPARASNLVVNGGFETGGSIPWLETTNVAICAGDFLCQEGLFADSWRVTSSSGVITPYDGSFFAATICQSLCQLSQTLATMPGVTYELSFALDALPGSPLTVGWGGNDVFDTAGTAGWTLHTFDLVANSNSTVLSFNTPEVSGVGLDDVSVTPTPLPAALPLFATGIGGLGLLGWRRKRKAQVV
jgi:hypothetical protein